MLFRIGANTHCNQVYGIGVYPIVLEEHIDWAESAVALGSLIQARAQPGPLRVVPSARKIMYK